MILDAAALPSRSTATAWVPLPMQERALACGAYELLVGGAAGPGKSEYLVVAAMRQIHHPSYRAILFRNSFPELQRTLIEKSWKFYPSRGGSYNESSHTWTFPTGAEIQFSYLEKDKDVHRYQGGEFQFAGFDELPHFTEYQYRYMQSRLRGTAGISIRLRATANPDGPHLEWVRARFAQWIEKKAKPGEALWFDPDGRVVTRGTLFALSRSYIPGRLDDNPYLGPEYRAQLMALDPVTRAKLLDGDWDACVGEGKLFNKAWWHYLDAVPDDVEASVRSWDFGATTDGDPSEGVLMHRRKAKVIPRWVVSDVQTVAGPPHEVDALVKRTALMDGKGIAIVIPQDPGQAGIEQIQRYKRDLAGWTVIGRRPTVNKVKRAGPFSSQVGALNFALVRGVWVPAYVAQHHAFPDGPHDDKVDASSDAFAHLSGNDYEAAMRAAVEAQLGVGG